jgi:zinc-ribbon domain
MICINCGTALPDNAIFCNKCGKSQQKPGLIDPLSGKINLDSTPTRCPFPPRTYVKVMPLKGTSKAPAGAKGTVQLVYDDHYCAKWEKYGWEDITKAENDLYMMVYTY